MLCIDFAGCSGIPLPAAFIKDAVPPAEGEPVACTERTPCPGATQGVWMPTDLAAYFAATQSCCNDCQEKLKGCDSNSPEWWVIALSAGLGVTAGGFIGYQLAR